VSAGDAERDNHNDGGEYESEPVGEGDFNRPGMVGAVEYYCGEYEQCDRNKDGREDRRGPWGWYQKQYVPVHDGGGPVEEDLQPDVVEDIPDREDGEEVGETPAVILAEQI